MTRIEMCIKTTAIHCVFSQWKLFERCYNHLIKVIKELEGLPDEEKRNKEWISGESVEIGSGAEILQRCRKDINLKNLKSCGQKVFAISSALHDSGIGIDKKSLKKISQCFSASLKNCSPSFIKSFIRIILVFTNSLYHANITESDDYDVPTETSVKVTPDELDICDTFVTEGHELSAEEVCLPYLKVGRSSKIYILQKTCTIANIEKWNQEIANCVSEKAQSIGLKNPNALNLLRVVKIVDDCCRELTCRPKNRENFKVVLNSIFSTIKRFTFTSAKESCLDYLSSTKLVKCIPKLHRYFVLNHWLLDTEETKEKAFSCFQNSLTKCSEVSKKIFHILYSAIAIQAYEHEDGLEETITCEPDNSYVEYCGNSNIGIDRQTNPISILSNEDNEENSIFDSHEEYDESFEMDALNLNFNDSELHKAQVIEPIKMCSHSDYELYFENILNCQNLRRVLLNNETNRCSESFLKKSIESIILCMFEDEAKLPCFINNTVQLRDFLTDLGVTLSKSLKVDETNCFHYNHCNESSLTSISKCTNIIYSQLKISRENINSIAPLNGRKGFNLIHQCLSTIWSRCSSNISLLTLPIIYIPLEMKLPLSLKETANQICLSSNGNHENECKETDRREASDTITSCLQRVVTKLINLLTHLQISTKKVRWTIDPLSICVSTHPILECIERNSYEFKRFSFELLNSTQSFLQQYLNTFYDPVDLLTGRECMKVFSDHSLDRCLAIMFEYMTNYHNGRATESDYPSDCVENIFKACGDTNAFHILMKKTMNIPAKTDTINPIVSKICLETKHNGSILQSCTMKEFENTFTSSPGCLESSSSFLSSTNVQSVLKYCKSCVWRNTHKKCYYDIRDLKTVASKVLEPLKKCLVRHNIEEKCAYEVTHDVKNKCILYFHLYSFNIKMGTFLQAVESSKDFTACIERTVKSCSTNIHKDIFTFYKEFTGLISDNGRDL